METVEQERHQSNVIYVDLVSLLLILTDFTHYSGVSIAALNK